MAAALSTYAETQKTIDVIDQTTTIDNQAASTTDTSQIEDNTDTTEQTQMASNAADVSDHTTKEGEENVSDFSIDLGETVAAVADTTQPQQKTATQPIYNWKDEIKKIDKKELLKEVGITDFALEMDEYLQKGGKAEDYLGAKSIDYNKISDEDLIKSDLKKQYPGFSSEKIDKLFNAKYGISDLDTDDIREQKELQLEADGYLKRQQKITEQQKFKIPEAPILHTDAAYEQWKKNQESQSKLIEQGKLWFLQHEATKSLNESKRVTVNLVDGVAPFNFKIDKPEIITQNLTDEGEIWSKLTSTKTGEPDVPKQQLITLFAINPQKFIQDIFNYGVSTGARKLVAEGQNAQKPSTPVHSISGEKPVYRTGTYGGGKK